MQKQAQQQDFLQKHPHLNALSTPIPDLMKLENDPSFSSRDQAFLSGILHARIFIRAATNGKIS